ncbi:Inner membrane transport permease ybhR [Bacteroidales bacterium Barb7]|nr:Inner membrane transport permease ybhR [Bacteroidales bacterium Barb7]
MLRFLLEKEFKRILRDRFIPRIMFLLPLMQLIILPFAANFEMRNINLSVVDNDKSAASRQMIDKVLSSGYFRLTDVSASYGEALTSVESNASDIILEIPHGFEKNAGHADQPQLLIAANAINGTKGGLGSAYLTSIITPQGSGGLVSSLFLFNPHLNYKYYMVPGIMVFFLTIIGGFLSALNIVSEKEKGTIEQINVTPIPKYIFLLSKLIPFWIVGFILLTLSMLTAWVIYGLSPVGSVLTIYLFAAVYLIAFTGFGLAISSVSSTQQQAMFTAFFFLLIFALLSGLFTPISSMPEWAQRLTLFNPVRYFVEVMRMVYLKGSTLADLSRHIAVIFLFAVSFNTLAVVCYRKKE